MGRNDTVFDMMETALCRFPFMDCLGDEPKDKRTLVAELECSRSTVNRGIRELEALDLVAYVDGGYRLTALGGLVESDFTDLAETVELRLKYEPFLRWMPDDEFDLDLGLLRDADLLVPKPADPYAMINRHVEVVEQADTQKCILPVVGLHGFKAAHKQTVENGAQCEIVVTAEVANTLQSNPDYAGLTEEMATTGRFRAFQYRGQLPYFVGILDDVVQIGVDDEGEPRALVETRNGEIHDWAEDIYQEYKAEAEPVQISSVSPQIP